MKTLNKLGNFGRNMVKTVDNRIIRFMTAKSSGIDGLLVTVGLCIIALVLCVVMKDSLKTFIESIVSSMQQKATAILDVSTV